ncbi:50S ribosomal protein L4 [Metallumcola ferriviriculae]|uniref:Large ribosomal subunit protein uL4 n=1 Tax=Metallumcola ferriviriculae TaxID=3039180 RepID=A0AAU0UGK2_9FIRM|nr:50S ribosomal protein L4 [Desulfitibacteraceae bacterium MK1]
MPKVALYNVRGEQVGDVELQDSVFGAPINEHVMHEAVVAHLANRRRGTHATKSRGEVRGGGKKPWRQKGTGRARVGTIRSPLWRGGAITFGPSPRDYSTSIPKKVRRLAIKSALSSKVLEGSLIVVDDLKFEKPRTKEMAGVLNALGIEEKALVISNGEGDNVRLSARNIASVKPLAPINLNAYDILNYNKVVITKDAVHKVEEVLG